MQSGERGTIWRFGRVEFHEAEGRLLVEGTRVILDRSCRAVLAELLRHAGNAVGKERLLEAGWPNRIVHENSLAKAISRLRVALGAEGEALEAVYGHGYKLDVVLQEAGSQAGVAAAPSTRGARPWSRPVVLAAWVACLAVAGLGGVMLLDRSADGADIPIRTTPPVIGDAPDAAGVVLWVDDHPQNNVNEKRFFENHRIAVHNVTGSADALKLLAIYRYKVVISDMGRGDDRLAGIRLAEQMRERGNTTPLIIYTVRPDGAQAQRAQREMVSEAGADGLMLTPEDVRATVLRMFGNPAPRPTP